MGPELGINTVFSELKESKNRRSILKRALLLLLSGVLLLVTMVLCVTGYHPFISYRNQQFQEAVSAVQPGKIVWNELVPFEWDEVYLFHAYIQKKQMEEILGFDSGVLPYEVGEGTSRLIFLKNGKIISTAYACDSMSDRVPYVIMFPDQGRLYEYLSYDDQAVFNAEKRDRQMIPEFYDKQTI